MGVCPERTNDAVGVIPVAWSLWLVRRLDHRFFCCLERGFVGPAPHRLHGKTDSTKLRQPRVES